MITAIRKEITEIKKLITVIKFALIFVFIFLVCRQAYAEEVTITTYYPAPEGVYDELRSTKMGVGPNYYNAANYPTPANNSLIIEPGVGIGTSNPNSAALLDLTSNVSPYQGFLLPRMTTGQRDLISSAPAGLVIYNTTTNNLEYRNNAGWITSGFWADNGNNDIYNTNYNTGNVGIGASTSPNVTLQVNGSISKQQSTLNGTTAEKATQVNLGVNSTTGGSYSTIGGGSDNQAINDYATVCGGYSNKASAIYSTVGGGYTNEATNDYAVIAQGRFIKATGMYSIVTGGYGGGDANEASGAYSVAGGNGSNARADVSVALGGDVNKATAIASAVAGGSCNQAINQYATVIGGGDINGPNIGSGVASTVIGGRNNQATGEYSSIPGGYLNRAAGSYSFAAGRRAKANQDGSFVWADSTDADYVSNGVNTFNIRANGGVLFNGGNVGWDIAEYMDVLTSDKVQEAEIVYLKGDDLLGKSQKPYDDNLIGVVSSKRTSTLHLGGTNQDLKAAGKLKKGTTRLPVALAGRCFVKVTNQTGPIKIGDAITSSSLPGIGMKADKPSKIIGYAMQEERFKNKNTSEIIVFINSGYYIPKNTYEELKIKNQELRAQIELLDKEIAKIE